MKIEGLIPATVTPFKTDGSIDFKNLEEHIAAVGSAGGLLAKPEAIRRSLSAAGLLERKAAAGG